MAHIFISYNHRDSEYAHKLEAALKQRGFEVWIDDRIDYGTQWPRIIEQNLDSCAAVVVIMTARSRGSTWVQNELAYAIDSGKPIFPLLLEGQVWFTVASMQCVDVRQRDLPAERFYSRLAQVARRRRTTPPALRFDGFYALRSKPIPGLENFSPSDVSIALVFREDGTVALSRLETIKPFAELWHPTFVGRGRYTLRGTNDIEFTIVPSRKFENTKIEARFGGKIRKGSLLLNITWNEGGQTCGYSEEFRFHQDPDIASTWKQISQY